MPPDIKSDFDKAYAALANLEKTGRHLVWVPWYLYPPLVLWSAYAGASAALQGSWAWLVDLGVIAWLTWWGNKVENERAEIAEFVHRQRRKLAFLEKLHAGEAERIAAKGEITMPDGYARFQIICKRHSEPFAMLGGNKQAAARGIMQEFFARFIAVAKPASPDDFEKRIAEFAETEQAMCCYIGDEVMAKVLAATPPSTGDERKDLEAAMQLVPEVEPYDKRH